MCGISGIIGAIANPAILTQMLSKIGHRGEPSYFAEVSYGDGFAVGTNRLAIVDSSHGKQPFVSEDQRVLCISNGEIYNYKSFHTIYGQKYKFKTECDIESILAGYLISGEAIFDQIEGMYSVFIRDERNESWYLARDHLGIKPIYYAWDEKSNFYFSSELKSFEGLLLIKEIYTLLPGEVIKNGKLIKNRMLYPFGGEGSSETQENILSQGRNILESAVQKMIPNTGEKIACLLSGGVDSSTVLYLAYLANAGNVEAYTFYNKQAHQSDDYEAAKQICSLLGIKLITVSPTIEELMDFYLKRGVWMTETFECALVRNAVSYHFLCKAVRDDGYKFALSGEGADEILGGYDYFSRLDVSLRDQAIAKSLEEIHRTYLQMSDRASMFATLEVRVPYMDEDFTSYVTQLPSQYRISEKGNKWLLRNMYEGEIPDNIRLRAKVGMNQGAGYGSNDPGESIYYQAISKYYMLAPMQMQNDLELTQAIGRDFGLIDPNQEEIYNFSRYIEYGFGRLKNNQTRPQLNTSQLVKSL